jgi:hypothetical protein
MKYCLPLEQMNRDEIVIGVKEMEEEYRRR